jgi:hypothetical protein
VRDCERAPPFLPANVNAMKCSITSLAPAVRGGAAIGTRVLWLVCLQLALGCADAHDLDDGTSPHAVEPDDGGPEPAKGSSAISSALERACMQEIADSSDGLPQHLRCAGLYADPGNDKLAKGVFAYTPGLVLWSDGAEKHRWIYLPEGEKIDASNSGDWTFPVGTKLFKEFALGTRRVETRLFQKVRDDRWVRTTYAWDESGTDAVRSGGGDVDIDGTSYHIPGARECDQCHQGRKDRVLGFEAIGLGVAGADGLTLDKLVDRKLIAPAPKQSLMKIADDGSGNGAEIIGWIHMNCGVSCHNDNPAANAHSTMLRLRLSPDELDGRPASEYAAIKNTVNVDATTVRWKGQKRIVPGSPDESLLYTLVSSRVGKNDQMPPIATRIVDQQHLDMLRAWIENLQ